MGALLVGLGAVPVRKTGHAGLSTDSRAAPGARVRAVISGSSGRAEPFKEGEGCDYAANRARHGLAGASTLVAPTIRCGLPK
jgi:hypothetical protein